MIRLPEHNDKVQKSNLASGDIEESLSTAGNITSHTREVASSKLTAKVYPFEVKKNDLMESSTPPPENQKVSRNPPFFPGVGYPPFGSPLANFHLYNPLWSAQAGLVNPLTWPFIFHQTASPVFAPSSLRTQVGSSERYPIPVSKSQNSTKATSNSEGTNVHAV